MQPCVSPISAHTHDHAPVSHFSPHSRSCPSQPFQPTLTIMPQSAISAHTHDQAPVSHFSPHSRSCPSQPFQPTLTIMPQSAMQSRMPTAGHAAEHADRGSRLGRVDASRSHWIGNMLSLDR
eukprot:364385-Chlamydomonas_euryale.AAC.8